MGGRAILKEGKGVISKGRCLKLGPTGQLGDSFRRDEKVSIRGWKNPAKAPSRGPGRPRFST